MPVEKKCRVGILVLALIMMSGFCGAWSWGGVESRTPVPVFVFPYFPLPQKAELCGEPVPMQSSDVRERFDREFTIVTQSNAQVYLWLKRMERYFPWLEKQLAARGLPDDLKYVAVAESDLMTHAVSSAGAAGPWQFMAATAASYGMNQTPAIDERYDFEIAAAGAFKYLKNLHGAFGNWALAIAAYNCGEKRVQDEMKKQKVNSYFLLKLPQETERYVFRILAIKEVLKNPEKYGYHLPKGAGYKPVLSEKVNINLSGGISLTAAAEAAGTTYRDMRLLNPWLIADYIPKGAYSIRVPAGRGKEFVSRIDSMKTVEKPSGPLFHKVAKGESLEAIARRYNSTSQQICGWNKITKNKIRIGQVLKIYR